MRLILTCSAASDQFGGDAPLLDSADITIVLKLCPLLGVSGTSAGRQWLLSTRSGHQPLWPQFGRADAIPVHVTPVAPVTLRRLDQ